MKFIFKRIRWSLFLLTAIVLGCLDPYAPPTDGIATDFLVVDGVINATNNIVTVKLSRATALSDATSFLAETNADVFVEDEKNQKYKLAEVSTGVYSLNQAFDYELQYRLSITTKGEDIVSEFVDVIKNSPIDSLTWKADNERFSIFVNSHDFSEGKKYYRYTYEETHQYSAKFFSGYKLVNGEAIYRTPDEWMFTCWITKPIGGILLASTENFSQNIISEFQILKIQRGDRRLWQKYSVLVQQISVDKKTYTYWEELRKMTESLGGLFDPLPYQVKGNLESVSNPDKTVIGYFSAGEVFEKRVVVSINELPRNYSGVLQSSCTESNVKIADMHTLVPASDILTYAEMMGPFVVGYFYSTPSCTDCRLEGGTNVRPDFMN
jgi:Domain of unknown function (DUF4249)